MYRMQSGGWPYSEDGRDSSKAPSLHVAFLRTAVFRSLRSHTYIHKLVYMYIHSSINNHDVNKSDSSCYGFAREDAERAKSSVKVIEGRPVQLSFATRKPPRKKRKKEGGEEGEAVKNPREERKKGGEEVKNPREERKKGGEEVKNTREKKEKGGEEVKNPREKRKKGGGKEAWTNDDGVKNSREEGRTQGGRRRERAHEVDDSNRLALVMNNKCMQFQRKKKWHVH